MKDVHPIQDAPAIPLEQRVHRLEVALAKLWDEVWWHQLPFYRRWYYAAQGFRSPIRRFYVRLEDVDRAHD
jgi:hypothetical protein